VTGGVRRRRGAQRVERRTWSSASVARTVSGLCRVELEVIDVTSLALDALNDRVAGSSIGTEP
jgi:hypothetical protein